MITATTTTTYAYGTIGISEVVRGYYRRSLSTLLGLYRYHAPCSMLHARRFFRMNALLLMQLCCWLLPHEARGLAPSWFFGRRPNQNEARGNVEVELPTPVKVSPKRSTTRGKVRLRTTQAADLSHVAQMLSTAATVVSGSNTWKTRMDQLWAKVDIEALLRGRLQAMEQGQKSLQRLSKNTSIDNDIDNDTQILLIDEQRARLEALWANDRFRHCLRKASRETGEANVWQQHNFALVPTRAEWLQHLQITAFDESQKFKDRAVVVGFVEVAMLSNPCVKVNGIGDDTDSSCPFAYSPAITNLAVSETHRRQGIATRLIQTAHRFARLQWKTAEVGLYVEISNTAAIALYESNGYAVQRSVSGGAQLSDMYYMTCSLSSSCAVPVVR